jgi:hypothetical protein
MKIRSRLRCLQVKVRKPPTFRLLKVASLVVRAFLQKTKLAWVALILKVLKVLQKVAWAANPAEPRLISVVTPRLSPSGVSKVSLDSNPALLSLRFL